MEVGLAIGGAFLSSALNVFFDRMTPKFPSLFRGHNGADQLLKKLKRTLIVMEAVLDDAEDKQITNKNVKDWLFDLKATVYDAEDLVDEINTEVLRLEVKGGEQSVTHTVSQLSDKFLKEILPKIEKVVTSLEDFESQINVLGLKRVVSKKDNSYRLPSTCLVDESNVCGRDTEREKLVQMVLYDNTNRNNISVIPIVGMGGLGKTTLAQVVYGDERVNKHFDTRAWVCVSENYDLVKITKTLVGEITRSNFEDRNEFNMLQVKLKESLAEKKFLIVLDDVWNDNYNDWDKLKAPLKYGKQGSKIIVTTRNENVALMMHNEPIHYLTPILDDDCWSLFKKHAFDTDGSFASPEFEKIGKEIVQKCNGLPLAVKTLGGLLRSKRDIKEWGHILKSEFWTLENESSGVLLVLRLSYHHLPPHLKHCFAFCALFPKNYHFSEKELILLWMANDLLQHPTQNDKTIEDVGCEYFSELRSRSFFQKVSGDEYLMHDLVNDLARYVGGKFCVRLEDYRYGENLSKARHFLYMSEYYNASKKFKFLAQFKSLRTFFGVETSKWGGNKLTQMFLLDMLPGLGRLRVLSLCGYDIKQLPTSICTLKHLRNVNLSWARIELLPDVICNLYNLQTLLLIKCRNLRKLPMNFTKLVNLRHLDLSGTELLEMPSHMSRLKSLQTLSYFVIGNSSGRSIKELGKFHLRGYLKIMGLQNVINGNDALEANLRGKHLLEDLVLQWRGDTDDSQIAKDIFDKLQPHPNLKSLTIDGYGGKRFADWLADDSLCNIVSLYLTNCKNCFCLPALGHLESLKVLTIKSLDSIIKIGEEFCGDGSLIKPFQSLVTLRIEHISELEEWDTSGNVKFSCLEELYIEDCPKLKGDLPSKLICLKTFEISGCPKLVFPVNWMTISPNNQIILRSHMSSLRISDMPLLNELPEELLRLGVGELSVSNCHNLISSPRVMIHVDKIILNDCASLVSLPIVGPSANIKKLYIKNCTNFEFPTSQNSDGHYPSIEDLEVCKAGDSFNDISLGLFPKLQTLELSKCESLKIFLAPRDIQNPTLLHRLTIGECNSLSSFPRGGLQAPNLEYFEVYSCKKLKSLPEQMHSLLPSLRVLHIYNCSEIECFPEGGLPSSLETLAISYCKKLMRCQRDWGLQRLPALTEFIISGDDEYEEESFPDEWLLPSSLRDLYIWEHKKLKTLNEKGLLRLTSLQTLEISCCHNLMSLPKEGLPTSLQTLQIENCPNLVSLPNEGLPTSLQTLQIRYCPNLVSLPKEGLPTSLQTLQIWNCPNLVSLPKEGLPTSLQTLQIYSCTKLQAVPTSPKTLGILCCPMFKSLPEQGLPTFLEETTSLFELHVRDCPLLTPHLERERGKYWRNIAHIPTIVLDDVLIS